MSVGVYRDGRAGRIVLDRPEALNALDLPTITAIDAAIRTFEADPAVHVIVLEGAGGRAFCAGGDLRGVYAAVARADAAAIEAFFAAEYALDRRVAECRTPCVALVDGICMGGGVGLSVHSRARIATERAVFAMPETGIGFFPDVGTSHVLPRMPGNIGYYLGLTGTRLAGGDAVHAGFATHFVAHDRLSALTKAITRDGAAVIAAFAERLPPFTLAPHRAAIDAAFDPARDDTEQVLRAENSAFATQTLAALARASPSALAWTRALLAHGATRNLRACLDQELRLARAVAQHPDLPEGVRAAVIDKDRAPSWAPYDAAQIAGIVAVL